MSQHHFTAAMPVPLDEYEKLRACRKLVEQIADFQLYGEEFTPSDADDAELVLNALIRQARKMAGTPRAHTVLTPWSSEAMLPAQGVDEEDD
jgi:hypothetical protein